MHLYLSLFQVSMMILPYETNLQGLFLAFNTYMLQLSLVTRWTITPSGILDYNLFVCVYKCTVILNCVLNSLFVTHSLRILLITETLCIIQTKHKCLLAVRHSRVAGELCTRTEALRRWYWWLLEATPSPRYDWSRASATWVHVAASLQICA
jgi:hypothetical protein